MQHITRLARLDRRAFSLVELLVVCVIIVALSAITMSVYMGHGKGPNGKAHSPMERAHDVECSSNLSQLRSAIIIEQTNDENGKFPASLQQLKGLPKNFILCPVGKEPFQYDPATGQVHCVHPGHEKY